MKKVVFLDELPWPDTAQSGFIPALKHFWNVWAIARTDIILAVCGSAAAWVINKPEGISKGFLSIILVLFGLPLSLKGYNQFSL